MTLALMQPYFFPYIGYFSLVAHADKWVFFDTAQYINGGWINRNRVLKEREGEWRYINVPLEKHKSTAIIKDVRIKDEPGWENKIIRQLQPYKKIAPYYQDVIGFIHESFQNTPGNISALNALLLKKTCDFLGIPFEYTFLSEMDLKLDNVKGPDGWALEIAKAVGADEYVNAPGGKAIFKEGDKFKKEGIKLKFIQPKIIPYTQNGHASFISHLSIIDVLMFNSRRQTQQFIHEYGLEEV